MKNKQCPICKGKMETGKTSVTLRRDRSVVVIDEVPADVCQNCEESVIESHIAQIAYELAEKEIFRGVSLEFCKFEPA